jgi:hypothetical protein
MATFAKKMSWMARCALATGQFSCCIIGFLRHVWERYKHGKVSSVCHSIPDPVRVGLDHPRGEIEYRIQTKAKIEGKRGQCILPSRGSDRKFESSYRCFHFQHKKGVFPEHSPESFPIQHEMRTIGHVSGQPPCFFPPRDGGSCHPLHCFFDSQISSWSK